jgi:hypothetical protein
VLQLAGAEHAQQVVQLGEGVRPRLGVVELAHQLPDTMPRRAEHTPQNVGRYLDAIAHVRHAHYHVHEQGGTRMKSERVVLLTTPEFKTFLTEEARREGTSVAELVRNRCQSPQASVEEQALAELTAELRRSVAAAKRSLREGLDAADAVLAELRQARGPRVRASKARRAA